MTEKLTDVQKALEESHQHSSRPGKWSTVPDVKNFEGRTTLTALRRLVKEGSASEKIKSGMPLKLFKPTRAGAGATGVGMSGEDRGGKDPGRGRRGRKTFRPRRTKGNGKPRDDKDPRRDKKPRDDKKPDGRRRGKPSDRKPDRPDPKPSDRKGPRLGDAVQGTVGAGITTLLVGGMGGSAGGSASVTKVGALPTVRM
jgi:hypothetical protein